MSQNLSSAAVVIGALRVNTTKTYPDASINVEYVSVGSRTGVSFSVCMSGNSTDGNFEACK